MPAVAVAAPPQKRGLAVAQSTWENAASIKPT
jgi:hypothetical protein